MPWKSRRFQPSCAARSVSTFFEAIVLCPFRSEEHTSELQSRLHPVCRLLLEKKNVKEGDTIKVGHIVFSLEETEAAERKRDSVQQQETERKRDSEPPEETERKGDTPPPNET